jgi:hypothetical protein
VPTSHHKVTHELSHCHKLDKTLDVHLVAYHGMLKSSWTDKHTNVAGVSLSLRRCPCAPAARPWF